MAHDHDHDVADDDFDDIDIKEALGLPDALPPIRLLPLPELAAQARTAPLVRQLAGLTEWIGKDGREVDDDGLLSPEDAAEVAAAVGVDGDELALLWEYALAVEWLEIEDEDEDEPDGGDEDDQPFRVVPGETADDWATGDDESVFAAWGSTFAAVLSETLLVYGPEPLVEAEDEEDEPEFDFVGQGMAMAVLLFLARRDGLTRQEFAEVLWENAAGGHDDGDTEAHEEIAAARAEWEAEYGDAAGLLLAKLVDARAVTQDDDLIRLTPLALATLHEQLVEAGVEIGLLAPTAAELSGTELLAMAAGVSDAEFEAEADAWTAARGAAAAASELLELAAEAEPGERMLAVTAVTRIGEPAGPAWRQSLAVPQVRAYAKVALAQLSGVDTGGGDLPAELEMTPDDLAWVATDLLAIAIDDEYPDPGELAVSFREAVPAGREQVLFEGMARGGHPDTVAVLRHLGQYHPDKQVAKAARTAAHRAESRP